MNEERIAGTFVGIVWKRGDQVSRVKVTYRDDPRSAGVDVQVSGVGRQALLVDAAKALAAALDMQDDVRTDADAIFGTVA